MIIAINHSRVKVGLGFPTCKIVHYAGPTVVVEICGWVPKSPIIPESKGNGKNPRKRAQDFQPCAGAAHPTAFTKIRLISGR